MFLHTFKNKISIAVMSCLVIISNVSAHNDMNTSESADKEAELIVRGMIRDETSHNDVYHKLQRVDEGIDGRIYMTLNDGTIWQVRFSDAKKHNIFKRWKPDHYLVMAVNRSWWASQHYRIINQSKNEEVYADLYWVPGHYTDATSMKPSTRYIQHVQYDTDEIILDDGSLWRMTDRQTLRSWVEDDVVVIGLNDSVGATVPNILINHRTRDYARGEVTGWLK